MKRKIFSVLLTLVLVLSLGLVMTVPAVAEPVTTDAAYSFTVVETGTAAWVTTEKTLGDYSVELALGDGVNDAARVVIPASAETLLSDISTISFWWECLAKDPAQTYIAPPYATFEVDTNDSGTVDQWVVNFVALELDNCIYAESVVWTERTLPTDNDHWAIFGTDEQGITPETALTWAEVLTAVEAGAGVGTVLNYKVAIGQGSETSPWPVETVYIDDVTINETTYVLEPRVINTTQIEGFNTIQAAIDVSLADETILVADGIYEESISITTANLTLRSVNGRDSTSIVNVGDVVSPEPAQCGFLIRGPANDFTLGGAADQGFTFSGGTAPRLIQLNNGPSGVEISHNTIDTTGTAHIGIQQGAAVTTGLTVSYNTFTSGAGSFGVTGPNLVDVTVTYNDFSGVWDPEFPEVDIYTPAIFFTGVTGTSSTISNNTITLHGRGILLENGTGTSDLLVSGNNISNSFVGIKFDQSVGADMTTVNVTRNTLSTNYRGIHVVDGANVLASHFTIKYNNIIGSTNEGLLNDPATETVNATDNYWGHSSGPADALNPFGIGDEVSSNVIYNPWLLVEVTEAEPTTYQRTLALRDGWSIVSPDAEVANHGIVEPDGLVYAYGTDPITGERGFLEETDLDPIIPVFIKTDGGGGIGFNYVEDSWGIFTTNLEAGWNLIGIPYTEANLAVILSPLCLGERNEVALATLVSQGHYNPSGLSYYYSMLDEASWTTIAALTTANHVFDGCWAYMNVAKEFGVVVVLGTPQ